MEGDRQTSLAAGSTKHSILFGGSKRSKFNLLCGIKSNCINVNLIAGGERQKKRDSEREKEREGRGVKSSKVTSNRQNARQPRGAFKMFFFAFLQRQLLNSICCANLP